MLSLNFYFLPEKTLLRIAVTAIITAITINIASIPVPIYERFVIKFCGLNIFKSSLHKEIENQAAGNNRCDLS